MARRRKRKIFGSATPSASADPRLVEEFKQQGLRVNAPSTGAIAPSSRAPSVNGAQGTESATGATGLTTAAEGRVGIPLSEEANRQISVEERLREKIAGSQLGAPGGTGVSRLAREFSKVPSRMEIGRKFHIKPSESSKLDRAMASETARIQQEEQQAKSQERGLAREERGFEQQKTLADLAVAGKRGAGAEAAGITAKTTATENELKRTYKTAVQAAKEAAVLTRDKLTHMNKMELAQVNAKMKKADKEVSADAKVAKDAIASGKATQKDIDTRTLKLNTVKWPWEITRANLLSDNPDADVSGIDSVINQINAELVSLKDVVPGFEGGDVGVAAGVSPTGTVTPTAEPVVGAAGAEGDEKAQAVEKARAGFDTDKSGDFSPEEIKAAEGKFDEASRILDSADKFEQAGSPLSPSEIARHEAIVGAYKKFIKDRVDTSLFGRPAGA